MNSFGVKKKISNSLLNCFVLFEMKLDEYPKKVYLITFLILPSIYIIFYPLINKNKSGKKKVNHTDNLFY